ncbi:2,3-diphosphoglycerate-dependent phosphoglycerate mutase [Lientehia hominis]
MLLRHGESVWNKENLFTGWTDVNLSDDGREEAREAGRQLRERGYEFDICYTSYLKRAIHTLDLVLEELDMEWLPVIKDWHLNERHYGALQGLNKAETAEKYGEEQVKIWRRSFDVRPPALSPDDGQTPARQRPYREIPEEELPLAESLKDTIARVIPYFEEQIRPQLMNGRRVLVTAHGNSLRALVMYLEHLSEEEVVRLNLPTGVPLVYHLDENLAVEEKKYLGDPETVAAKMQKVANQGMIHRS